MATVPSVRTTTEHRLSSSRDSEAILRQLEQILAGPAFCNSKRCSSFLRFIVERTLLGHPDQLKERMIGIAVFDRPPDYDAATDAIVRVTAGEVRRRLAQYYVENAHRDELRIRLEPGSYVPEFEPHISVDVPAEPATATLSLEEGAPEVSKPRNLRKLFLAGGLAAACIAIGAIVTAYWLSRPTTIERFWQPFFHAQGSVLVCLGDLTSVASNSTHHQSAIQTSTSSSDLLDLGDVQAMNHVSRVLTRRGVELVTTNSAQATLSDLRRQPNILIGGSTNQWTLRAMPLLRYQLARGISPGINGIRDRDDHNRVRWTVDFNTPIDKLPMTYAIIARYLDPDTNQPTVIIDGIGAAGTIAGADFLTSAHYFEDYAAHAPRGWEKRNIEILIQTQLIGGEYGPPRVIATYYW